MFDDKRSKKVIFTAHCILNQNAKLDRCAHYPGAIKEITDVLLNKGIGIIQMPCPELMFLGLDRKTDLGSGNTIAEEDTRISVLMNESKAKVFCSRLIDEIAQQIFDYNKNGFTIIAVLGINGSPTCGVETGWKDSQESGEPGVFIKLLQEKLVEMNLTVPFAGIKASEAEKALQTIENLF